MMDGASAPISILTMLIQVLGLLLGREVGSCSILVCETSTAICASGTPQDKHVCYKNWSNSSSEMETDIILEGFFWRLNESMEFAT